MVDCGQGTISEFLQNVVFFSPSRNFKLQVQLIQLIQ